MISVLWHVALINKHMCHKEYSMKFPICYLSIYLYSPFCHPLMHSTWIHEESKSKARHLPHGFRSQEEVSKMNPWILGLSSYFNHLLCYLFFFPENDSCWYNTGACRGSSPNTFYRENISALSAWYSRMRQWSVKPHLLPPLAVAARYFRDSQNRLPHLPLQVCLV